MDNVKLAPLVGLEAANDADQYDYTAQQYDALQSHTERFATRVEIPADLVTRYYRLDDYACKNLGQTIYGLLEKYCATCERHDLRHTAQDMGHIND